MSSIFCKACGAETQPGKKFCAACGAPLAPSTPPRQETPGQNFQPAFAQRPSPPPAYIPGPVQQPMPQPAYAQPMYTAPPKKRGNAGKVIWIILGSIIGLIALIIAIAFFAVNSTANADYYKLGQDYIPSIKLVVGKRTVSKTEASTANGITTKTIEFKDIEAPTDDLTEYIDYLRHHADFGVSMEYDPGVSPGSTQLVKESGDEGKIIILDIEYDESGYTLVMTKCEGTITDN